MRRLLLLLGCLLSGLAHAQVIHVGGSNTVGAFMERAIEVYQNEHPEVLIELSAGGTDAGLKGIREGGLDIGLMSRDPTQQELAGLGGVETLPIGMDAVAIVVSDQLFHQGLQVLAKEEIASILAGRIANWKQVGGPDRAILVIDETRAHGTRQVLARYFFGDARIANFPGAAVVSEHKDMATLLIASDQAIGFLPFAELSEHLHGIGIAEVGKVYIPKPEAVRSGDYPLVRKLWLLVRKDAQATVRRFVEFLRSEQGRSLLKEVGYIPLQ